MSQEARPGPVGEAGPLAGHDVNDARGKRDRPPLKQRENPISLRNQVYRRKSSMVEIEREFQNRQPSFEVGQFNRPEQASAAF